MIRTKLFLSIGLMVAVTGCSGMRKSENAFYSHAESIRILGYAVPGDDQARARELVPAGASITSVHSTPADWTSLLGIFGNILWFGGTEIGGTLPSK